MKNCTLFLLLIFCGQFSYSQVSTVISGFTTNLTKADLPFSGDRILYAIFLNDRNTNNYLVVSKNKSGADHDELYVEKFTENGKGEYHLTVSKKFTHPTNLALSFVNNRMVYQDSDKDGDAEFLYVVQEHTGGVGSPVAKTYSVAVYENTANLVWRIASDGFSKDYFDENFKKLPQNIKDEFLDFWHELSYD